MGLLQNKNTVMDKQFKKLQDSILGKVITDKQILDFYSVDASSFKIKPTVVVIPKNREDVSKAIRFAKRNKIPVTPRGAGTGLVGGALGRGMILDLKDLRSIKIGKDSVTVEAGVLKGMMDKELEKFGRFFPVNPSVGPYCSIGGMIANNCSGSRSLKYGSMIDNVVALEYVDSNGKTIRLPEDIHVSKKIIKYAGKIDSDKYPRVSKNSSGYRLDKISESETHRLLIGSEGTLGVIVSATLPTKEIPKKKTLHIIEYQRFEDTAKDIIEFLKTNPVAIEIIDKTTLRNIKFKFSKNTKCLLIVEHDNPNSSLQTRQKFYVFRDEVEINKWWKYRDSALYNSLKSIPEKNRIPNIIEDAAVPVDCLMKFFNLVNKIAKRYEYKLTMYGHVGNGNIHVRLAAKRPTKSEINKMTREFFDKIIALHGTITAEHGDGIARTRFVRQQYGSKNYKIFKEIKRDFDPNYILNPGKIVDIRND